MFRLIFMHNRLNHAVYSVELRIIITISVPYSVVDIELSTLSTFVTIIVMLKQKLTVACCRSGQDWRTAFLPDRQLTGNTSRRATPVTSTRLVENLGSWSMAPKLK